MKHKSDMVDFVGFSEVAETTTHLLALAIQQASSSPSASRASLSPVEKFVLLQARDYLSTVREGFALSVRTSNISQQAEVRFLLDRVMTDWDSLSRELGLEELVSDAGDNLADASNLDESASVEQVRQQLLAFGMAVIAMGYMPRLPSQRVTFPKSYSKPPTYRDIPVPHTPGELLVRIEEMEETIGQIMSKDLGRLMQSQYGPIRRTYGFFETSAWLSAKEVRRFGAKKQTGLHLL